mmetsp:Transcript_37941/g.82135  ORF Transcript_37941/g.82135 Transcript_37941/m.82135 type:complete len:96 (+) Transcript_37941:735-1022(+)
MLSIMENPTTLGNANIWRTSVETGGPFGLRCLSKELLASPISRSLQSPSGLSDTDVDVDEDGLNEDAGEYIVIEENEVAELPRMPPRALKPHAQE